MENIFVISFIATICFCVFKFVEMKFIDKNKEMKPLKFFVRDAVMVFVSSLFASFAYFYMNNTINEFMNTVTETKVLSVGTTEVFTDVPGF
jgi:hypothetical protein